MQDAAIIQATFSEWRMVKGRKVLQIICEVPLEAQGAVFGALGAPMPDSETWVAIARLRSKQPEPEQIADKPRPLSQIAGILCNEGAFQRFMRDEKGYTTDTAEAVRLWCGVDSRSQLDRMPEAAAAFRELRGEYEAWMRG